MKEISYINRDYNSIFENIKSLFKDLEPRVEIGQDLSNVETILTKIISGCVDSLSYNQDANIAEAFPSTARDPRAVFDLLSIVGYTPKTARSTTVYLTLWNPSFVGKRDYTPYTNLILDGYNFYNTEAFSCSQGRVTNVNFYQGRLVSPNMRDTNTFIDNKVKSFVDLYYPNLGVESINNDLYQLSPEDVKIDSRTVKVFTSDGSELTRVDNPYLVYCTPKSFSLIPSVNSTGYSLMFSKDCSSGLISKNYYYFYVVSEGYNIANNLIPDFRNFRLINEVETPTFSYSYDQDKCTEPETASEARKNVALDLGWRDTPKSLVTKYDAARDIMKNFQFIAAIDVRDGDDYSKCNSDKLDVAMFIKTKEDTELIAQDTSSALHLKNRILTYLSTLKLLPLNFEIHIDNVETYENEPVTRFYYWTPDVTVYLKEQVDAEEAGSILNTIGTALYERYKYENVDFREVPRTVDVIDTIQNSVESILYLDIDGITYSDGEGNVVPKYYATGKVEKAIPLTTDGTYDVKLDLADNRIIQFHTVKIVDASNNLICYDNGEGLLVSSSGYLKEYGSVDYTTGELSIELSLYPSGNNIYIYYELEDPVYTKLRLDNNSIKIALESIKAVR